MLIPMIITSQNVMKFFFKTMESNQFDSFHPKEDDEEDDEEKDVC